ncbi:MAG: helix-turn-helix transcriptional regulator [Terrimonas sp.]|nr:helix-turn-helix transcriptional regulator [Terrimonas sp.]OJY91473.1 MAG: AraC family transcriptional regulator [Sphingobacteriales bacterium 40-81]
MNDYCKYMSGTLAEEKWGLYIDTAGFSKVYPHQHYPKNYEHPSTHTFSWSKGRILRGHQLIYVSRGGGIFESEFSDPIEITEGTCMFLHAGVWHRYKPNDNSGWDEYWIGFNGNYANDLMRNDFFNVKYPFIKVGLSSELLNLFQKLIETVHTAPSGYQQISSGITLQILGYLYSVSLSNETEKSPIGRLIEKAKFLLQESLEKHIDLEKMARELPMGYSSFRKEFKRLTGEPPNQFVLNLRLTRAKYLLETTTLTINEIAQQTGFESVFYFSKLFKKRNGKSPKYYRSKTDEESFED